MISTVSITRGLRIDDVFARKLVDAMLADLAAAPMPTPLPSLMGNPKSQRRAFDRGLRVNGHRLLHTELVRTGTNFRFHMHYDAWAVDRVVPGWLVSAHVEIIGMGRGRKADKKITDTFALSRHALERLVKRGAVHSTADLITLLRNCWRATDLATRATSVSGMARDGRTTWLLPVEAPSGITVYLPLVRNTGPGALLVATTALSEDMLTHPESLEPLKQLLTADGEPDAAELGEALRLSAKATRRGRAASEPVKMAAVTLDAKEEHEQ